MARPKVTPLSADDDNEFDMPDEFAVPSDADDTARGQPSDVTGVLSDADVDELGFNDERDEAERAKLNPPTGDWEKADRWKSEKRVQAGNCMPNDIDSVGRTTFTFMGKPEPRQQNGIEYEPTLFLRISPDLRYSESNPALADMAYKLFLNAKDTYIAINGEKPKTLRALRVMLEEENYIIRTAKGDSGIYCVEIKAKKARK